MTWEITAVRMRCTSVQELQFLTRAIINEKGEGLILRKPLSRYEPGRSRSLWKIKVHTKKY
jgi:ATP-dependent DNA ligase